MYNNKSNHWLYIIAFIALTAIGCESTNNKTAEVTTAVEKPSTPDPSRKVVEVTYERATVYAGRTDYYFKTANGIRVEVGISNIEEDEKAKTPEGMLEKGTDGPPAANPEKVGQPYQLIYEKGQLIEIQEKE